VYPGGRRSPVGVAETEVVVLPRKIEMEMSSSGCDERRDERVRENRPRMLVFGE
jgi:hypothetical protein